MVSVRQLNRILCFCLLSLLQNIKSSAGFLCDSILWPVNSIWISEKNGRKNSNEKMHLYFCPPKLWM